MAKKKKDNTLMIIGGALVAYALYDSMQQKPTQRPGIPNLATNVHTVPAATINLPGYTFEAMQGSQSRSKMRRYMRRMSPMITGQYPSNWGASKSRCGCKGPQSSPCGCK